MPRQDLLALYRGGYLHDIGKISIPDVILFKRGLLTDEEWQTMRLHTIRGEEICRPMKTLAPVLPIIRSHHERWDGTGYPDGLAGEEIPLLARILQVADIYDALTTARPYKPAFSHQHAIEIMLEEVAPRMARSGTGAFVCRGFAAGFGNAAGSLVERQRAGTCFDATVTRQHAPRTF